MPHTLYGEYSVLLPHTSLPVLITTYYKQRCLRYASGQTSTFTLHRHRLVPRIYKYIESLLNGERDNLNMFTIEIIN